MTLLTTDWIFLPSLDVISLKQTWLILVIHSEIKTTLVAVSCCRFSSDIVLNSKLGNIVRVFNQIPSAYTELPTIFFLFVCFSDRSGSQSL